MNEKKYETLPNTGTLFAEVSKTNPRAPDFRGEALIDVSKFEVVDGKVRMQIGGWKKKTKDGRTWLSISFSPPYKGSVTTSIEDLNEDTPF